MPARDRAVPDFVTAFALAHEPAARIPQALGQLAVQRTRHARMFRRSGYRFAVKNMRHSTISVWSGLRIHHEAQAHVAGGNAIEIGHLGRNEPNPFDELVERGCLGCQRDIVGRSDPAMSLGILEYGNHESGPSALRGIRDDRRKYIHGMAAVGPPGRFSGEIWPYSRIRGNAAAARLARSSRPGEPSPDPGRACPAPRRTSSHLLEIAPSCSRLRKFAHESVAALDVSPASAFVMGS